MRDKLIIAALLLAATPVLAKEYVVKAVSDPAGDKPYYFAPHKLTIQPGDTVTFVNAQDDMHDVMFVSVPKGVNEMIMSPKQTKEGDKFSYTFTIPGTYKFHCHAHEALKMEGTLIVGQPSRAGETVVMDHHKMAQKAGVQSSTEQAPQLPEGKGTVNGINLSNHKINITHEPIKALGWPKMKMEFFVDPRVDLSGVAAGDAVLFTLKPVGNDDYVVVKLSKN